MRNTQLGLTQFQCFDTDSSWCSLVRRSVATGRCGDKRPKQHTYCSRRKQQKKANLETQTEINISEFAFFFLLMKWKQRRRKKNIQKFFVCRCIGCGMWYVTDCLSEVLDTFFAKWMEFIFQSNGSLPFNSNNLFMATSYSMFFNNIFGNEHTRTAHASCKTRMMHENVGSAGGISRSIDDCRSHVCCARYERLCGCAW